MRDALDAVDAELPSSTVRERKMGRPCWTISCDEPRLERIETSELGADVTCARVERALASAGRITRRAARASLERGEYCYFEADIHNEFVTAWVYEADRHDPGGGVAAGAAVIALNVF